MHSLTNHSQTFSGEEAVLSAQNLRCDLSLNASFQKLHNFCVWPFLASITRVVGHIAEH